MQGIPGTENQHIIEINNLTRRFRRKTALNDVSLQIRPGIVFGLVGENGAGKTTLIKHMLGLLRPTEGTVRLFGHDPIASPEEVLSRIGYLSEDRDLPGWMRVDELLRYTRAFYPNWDDGYAEELRQLFNLDPRSKVRTLSRGEKAKAGLITALAYRPELLLLDEPSSGLDPVVRRDILTAIIRTVADEGRTVLFSSHLLDEIERVADHIAMIRNGQVILQASMDDIKSQHNRAVIRLNTPVEKLPIIEGVLSSEGSGVEWTLITDQSVDALQERVGALNASIVQVDVPSLEDVFVARVGASRDSLREVHAEA